MTESMTSADLEEMMRPYKKLLGVSGEGLSGWRAYLGLPVRNAGSADRQERALVALRAIDELFRRPYLKDVAVEAQTDCSGETMQYCCMRLKTSMNLPRPISVLRRDIFLYARNTDALLKIPAYNGFLRVYYPDYENYWYFPAEDMAVHENLAQYADPTHRKKATIDTAYTKVPVRTAAGWSDAQRREYCLSVLRHLTD